MNDSNKTPLRIIAVVMALAALGWGVEVVRQVLQSDDGGPAIGAICMAVPSFALLIGAGAVWSAANRR